MAGEEAVSAGRRRLRPASADPADRADAADAAGAARRSPAAAPRRARRDSRRPAAISRHRRRPIPTRSTRRSTRPATIRCSAARSAKSAASRRACTSARGDRRSRTSAARQRRALQARRDRASSRRRTRTRRRSSRASTPRWRACCSTPAPTRRPRCATGIAAVTDARASARRRRSRARRIPRVTLPELLAGLTAVRTLRDALGSVRPRATAPQYEIDFRLKQKDDQFQQAIMLAHGLRIDAIADDGIVMAQPADPRDGERRQPRAGGRHRQERDAARASTATPACPSAPIKNTPAFSCAADVRIPADAKLTGPYWDRLPDAGRADARGGSAVRPAVPAVAVPRAVRLRHQRRRRLVRDAGAVPLRRRPGHRREAHGAATSSPACRCTSSRRRDDRAAQGGGRRGPAARTSASPSRTTPRARRPRTSR